MIKLTALPNGFFLVECPSNWEKWKTMNYGPYMMDGTGIFMKNWLPNFDLRKHEVEVVPTWVSLYNLPTKYWREEIQNDIGSKLGSFVKMDERLEDKRFGTYARICVKIFPFPPLPNEVELLLDFGVWRQKIERKDGLVVCSECSSKGHEKSKCIVQQSHHGEDEDGMMDLNM